MEKIVMEPVTHYYCDICKKEIGYPRYGRGEIIHGKCCNDLFRREDHISRIHNIIKEQKFF